MPNLHYYTVFDLENTEAFSIQEKEKISQFPLFPPFRHPLIPGPKASMYYFSAFQAGSRLHPTFFHCTFHTRFRVGASERVSGSFVGVCSPMVLIPPFLSFPVPAFGDRAVFVSVPRSGLWLVAEWKWRGLGELWRTQSASHNGNNVSVYGSARPKMPHPKCPLSPRAWEKPTDLIPLLLLAAVGLQLRGFGCCPSAGFEVNLKPSEICAIPVNLLIQ